MKRTLLISTMALAVCGIVSAQGVRVPRGSDITVRTNQRIEMKRSSDGRIYSAVVDRDVLDRNGNVAIPRGSDAELVVRNVNKDDMALDLEAVRVNGRRYVVSAEDQPLIDSEKSGVGKNERTAKYVGGGAVLGAIIGAIAGGGKGAAIGAGAGAAAGAGTQVMTRGRDIKVPPESLLTFRLDRGLRLNEGNGSADRYNNRYRDRDRRYPNDR